jgi:chromosome segregation ATPase
MGDIKMKASEYAAMTLVSLNTVKNRIKAGILNGAKEEDGIWYVYLTSDEYENLQNSKEKSQEREQAISDSIEKLKALPDGALIATYINIQRYADFQKQELMQVLSSLYALLAVKEKEIEFLSKDLDRYKSKIEELKEENLSLSEKLKNLSKELEDCKKEYKDLDNKYQRADIDMKKIILDKEKEILEKEREIEELKRKLSML